MKDSFAHNIVPNQTNSSANDITQPGQLDTSYSKSPSGLHALCQLSATTCINPLYPPKLQHGVAVLRGFKRTAHRESVAIGPDYRPARQGSFPQGTILTAYMPSRTQIIPSAYTHLFLFIWEPGRQSSLRPPLPLRRLAAVHRP